MGSVVAMLVLLCALLLAADAGTSPSDEARRAVKGAIEELIQRQDRITAERRAALLVEMRSLEATASPDLRPIVERLIRFHEADEPLQRSFPQFVNIARDLTRMSRGRFDEERAAIGAFLALPSLAQNAGADPEIYRKEALALARDLVARYPKEGRAHGLLASALLESRAEPLAVLPELKRCAELDPGAWCREHHARLVAELERPRCSGKVLTGPLTGTGAREWAKDRPGAGAVIEANGMKLVLEDRPFLTNESYSAISVDAEGNLSIEVTPEAAQRLASETRRLLESPSGFVVMRLGDQVLLAARVNEPIAGGRLRITHGMGSPPFQIDVLCSKIDRPAVPAELRLR